MPWPSQNPALLLIGMRSFKNKKVIGATKTTVDGIAFDSKLESAMYSMLKMHRIPFEMKQKVVLQPAFRYNREHIREIAIIPDFVIWLGTTILYLDTKGHQTSDNKTKVKLLKKYLHDKGIDSEIHLPSTNLECERLINHILKRLEQL